MKKIALILFSLITLTTYSQSTDSLKLDYYEYFDLLDNPNKKELIKDSLTVRFNIDIYTILLEPKTGYIAMIEIKDINHDCYIYGFNGIAIEELFQSGELQCRINMDCLDKTFGN
tara:strand:- start:592 stop:936 length:345 start_codon:yes stop_codon:yes gene_type:complete